MNGNNKDKGSFWLLLEILFRIKPFFSKIAETHKMTPIQLHIIAVVDPSKTYPMSALAHMLSCDASNVTGLIDRMVSLGFVKRCECTSDRRIKMVQLTDKGRELHAQVVREVDQAGQREFARLLTKSEHQQLRELLIKLTNGIDQAADKPNK